MEWGSRQSCTEVKGWKTVRKRHNHSQMVAALSFLVEDWYAERLGPEALTRTRIRGNKLGRPSNWRHFRFLEFRPVALLDSTTGRLLDWSTDGKQLSDSHPLHPPNTPSAAASTSTSSTPHEKKKKKRDFSQNVKTVEGTSAERKRGLEDWVHSVLRLRAHVDRLANWLTDNTV